MIIINLILFTNLIYSQAKVTDTRSLDEFLRVESQLQKQKQWEQGCELEKRSGRYPFSCLQLWLLSLEKPQSKLNLLRAQATLVNLCESGELFESSLKEAQAWLGVENLPKRCQKSLSEKIEDFVYIYSHNLGNGPNIE